MAKRHHEHAPEPIEAPAPSSDYGVSKADELSILKERIAELEAPVKVEYPKWVTGPKGERRIVQSVEEHKAVCGSLKE